MKTKSIIILLTLGFQISAQVIKPAQQNVTTKQKSHILEQDKSPQKAVKELKALSSAHNSSEDQFATHKKSNKLGINQQKHGGNGAFICESINYNRNHCFADTEGGIRLVRQLSRGSGYGRGSCLNNWGYDYYGVWVINGCRAEFATNRYENHYGTRDGVIRCESYRFERQLCRANLRNANVTLIHQLGRTDCSGNWGYDLSRIWVANGCKADFYVSANYNAGNNHNDTNYVDCFSQYGRTQACRVPELNGVEIYKIHSRLPESCRGNWGYSREGIWVRKGCQATFKIKRYGNYGGSNPYGNNNGETNPYGNNGGSNPYGNNNGEANPYGNNGDTNPHGNNGGSNNYPFSGDNASSLIKCKSKRYKHKSCYIGAFKEVKLEHVLGKSSCNNNWGIDYQSGNIWVDKGCKATFRVYR